MTLSQWSLSTRLGMLMVVFALLVVGLDVSTFAWAVRSRAEQDASRSLEQAKAILDGLLSHQSERAADKAELLAQGALGTGWWETAESLDSQRRGLGLHFLAVLDSSGALTLASPRLPLGTSLESGPQVRRGIFPLNGHLLSLAVSPMKVSLQGTGYVVTGYRVDSPVLHELARRSGVESVLRVKGTPVADSMTSQSWADVLSDVSSLAEGPGRVGNAEVRTGIQVLAPDVEWLFIKNFDTEVGRWGSVKRWVVLVGILLAGVLGGWVLKMVGGMTNALAALTSAVTTALEQENLSHPIPLSGTAEVAKLADVFGAILSRLKGTWLELRTAGVRIGKTTDKVIRTSDSYRSGVVAQESSLLSTSSTTAELARSSRQIAEEAGRVTQIAEETLHAARSAMEGASTFIQSIQQMSDDNRKIANTVNELHRHVQQVGKIVEFINGVADKSELLALNAELEGEKAGELGTGFSLVATEMRRLAENVLRSTREIESAMDGIRESAFLAVKATDLGVRRSMDGVETARNVTSNLGRIVSLADRNAEAARSMSASTLEQQTGTTRLAESMVEVLRVTQDSFRNSEEVYTAHQTLLALAEEVKITVDRFQVSSS